MAAELRSVAEKASPSNATKYRALADRAETGEFDDYGEVHVCGPTALYAELMGAGFTKFAKRVLDGEFDATLAESNEWANSAAGRAAMADFTPEARAKLFGVFDA
ncbi:MAG: hypothetical protein AAF899_06720 [Pseudomonadota bacterium]